MTGAGNEDIIGGKKSTSQLSELEQGILGLMTTYRLVREAEGMPSIRTTIVVHMVYKNSTYDKMFEGQTTAILTSFNDKNDLTNGGAHFVTIVHRPDGRVDVYNRYSDEISSRDYDSIADMINKNGKMLPISFTVIS